MKDDSSDEESGVASPVQVAKESGAKAKPGAEENGGKTKAETLSKGKPVAGDEDEDEDEDGDDDEV